MHRVECLKEIPIDLTLTSFWLYFKRGIQVLFKSSIITELKDKVVFVIDESIFVKLDNIWFSFQEIE